MAVKFISKTSVDAIFSETKIEDIVKAYVGNDLKEAGANLKCKSLYSNERTASLIVSPAKQIWKDFSSGKGGNFISFIYYADRSIDNYKDALLKAAEISNIYVEFEELTPDEERKYQEEISAKDFVKKMADFYGKNLIEVSDDHWAKRMLSERGYDEDTITSFQLGYAKQQYDQISSYANENGHTGLAKILGYSNSKGGKSYDQFINRLMFPIHNERGEVVGFGGRLSNDDVKNTDYAKYVNSKESDLYKKEQVVYGLFQAKKSIVENKKAILVEGYTDVISLHQKGINYTVASCGTALTNRQAKLIKKYCKEVIIWRDNDKAGQTAVLRDLDIFLNNGFKVSVLIAEDEKSDPDEISRKVESLDDYITKNSTDAILWRSNNLKEEAISNVFLQKEEELKDWVETKTKEKQEKVKAEIEVFKQNLNSDKPEIVKAAKKNIKDLEKQLPKDLKILEDMAKAELKFIPKYDSFALSDKLKEAAELIAYLEDDVTKNFYIKEVARIFDQKETDLKNIVKEKSVNPRTRKVEAKSNIGLPDGADPEQYEVDRFCEINNSYHFLGREGFFKATSFILNPLFHIEGSEKNKRLCEIISETGYKALIEFESKDLLNFNRFQEVLFDKGDLLFDGEVTTIHNKLLLKKISRSFIKAKEITNLGYQTKKNFWAYPNAIHINNELKFVNKYGIIQLDVEEEEGEYAENHKHYYSPAFSEIYKYMQGDNHDEYENDRYLAYKKSPVDIITWMNQIIKVYGFEKGSIGIAFLFASIFRSHITKIISFPMLGMFGEKGSGKSKLGESLSAFIFTDLPALNLQNGTLPGFAKRLERVQDGFTLLEEYNDTVRQEIWQSMKASYDGVGREISKRTGDNKTKISKVNSSICYIGQYLPTIDDGSLAERTIVLNFLKKMGDEYTIEEKEDFRILKSWEKQGLNSLVLEILQYRNTFVSKFSEISNKIDAEIRKSLKNVEFSERVTNNYTVLLSTIRILSEKIEFPFSYDNFLELCKNEIIENSDLVTEIGGMTDFWNTFQDLVITGFLVKDRDFMIDRVRQVKGYKKVKGKKEADIYDNKDQHEVLFIDFNRVYNAVDKAIANLPSKTMIGESSLKNYFKSKKYFLKSSVSQRIGSRSPSCYTFNYTEMERIGILDIRNSEPTFDEKQEMERNKIKDTTTEKAY
ncbi:DNA primase [Empedobacter falsenii]